MLKRHEKWGLFIIVALFFAFTIWWFFYYDKVEEIKECKNESHSVIPIFNGRITTYITITKCLDEEDSE